MPLLAANYLENWKCISVLRAGGGTSNPAPTNPPASHSSGGYSSGLSSSHQKDKPNNWLVKTSRLSSCELYVYDFERR